MIEFIKNIYFVGLYNPIFNVLVFFYNIVPDIGVAIIIVTLIIRLILFPSTLKSLRSNREMQALQPKINALREKYKDDKEKQSKELMKLYSKHKVNPLSSCLPLLIQAPILIAMYRVFLIGITEQDFSILYPFIASPGYIDPLFLGLIDLSATHNIVMALIAGGLQFWQSWMMSKKRKKKEAENGEEDKKKNEDPKQKAGDLAQGLTKNMMYLFPLVTIWFGYTLPAGLSLYWIVTTLFSVGQQYYIERQMNKEDAEKAARGEDDEDVIDTEVSDDEDEDDKKDTKKNATMKFAKFDKEDDKASGKEDKGSKDSKNDDKKQDNTKS